MLSQKEKATNNDTFRHIERVRNLLNRCISELLKRGEKHDQSKLEEPEVELFTEYTPKLAKCTYGSDEYKHFLEELKPALEHHYSNNRHHPEYSHYHETWKSIDGYEKLYEVSDLGRVRSCDKIIKRETQGNFHKDGKIRKPHITPKGYARISLSKDGQQRHYFIHTLVAKAFIPNVEDKTQINHKNGNKLDNRVNNLEWVTPSENLLHAYDTGLRESNVKYVVHCHELDITTFGTERMAKELRKCGYDKASSSAIYSCIAYDKNHTHLDLTFTSYNIDDYQWMDSPIENMNLIDVLEMLCDWKAASERHNDGNIKKSIEINANRFGLSPQLVKILENTINIIEDTK